jgi:hypothetical protein
VLPACKQAAGEERRAMDEGVRIKADADGTFTLYSGERVILHGLTREKAYRLASRLGGLAVEY